MSSSFPHSVAITAVAAANAAAVTAIGSSSSSSAPASSLLMAEQANNLRLMAVYDRISLFFNGGTRFETSDFVRLCYSLAKAVDCALTLNDIPGIAHRLPPLVKKVCEWRKNASVQSAIMMVLISIKNACRKGWFRTTDSEELLCMADEFCSKYCTELCPNAHVSYAYDTISKIMPRFYPGMILCSLIISFEAKLGYEIMMSDFHFSKNQPPEQKIVLIVVKTENLETSLCIASPPQVSFLVNGKGVEKRNNISLDHGPQFPSDISKMLKYGINVLQAIGYFDGTYLIAIAYVRKISTFTPVLKDYVQPLVAALESDSEIIEGPSRIQLSCPISFKRIKTPVKGHLCKHRQCFDYDNFLEMNSRKPNWRCPHCNQPVCITDLRVDRNLVKILEEASELVAEVVIHANGSWNIVAEQGRCTDHDVAQIHNLPHKMECETHRSKASISDPVDLTMGEEDICDTTQKIRQKVSMDGYGNQNVNLMVETEDRKPFIDVGGIQVPCFLANQQPANHHSNVAQVADYQLGNNINSTFMTSYATNVSMASAVSPNMPNMLGNLGLSDTVSPVLDQTQLAVHGLPAMRCETDRISGRSLPSHVDRIPLAVQALPVPSQAHGTSRIVHANVSPRQYQAVNPSTTLENFNVGIGNMDMQQIARTVADTSGIQSPHYVVNEGPLQHMVGIPSTSTMSRSPAGHWRGASDLDALRSSIQPSPFSRHSLQTPPGFRTPHQPAMPAVPPAARQAPQNAFSLASSNFGSHRSQTQPPLSPHYMRSPPASPASSLPSRDNNRLHAPDRLRSLAGGAPFSLSRSDSLPEPPLEQNWRPAGRMRGSLTGSDYSAVISNYMAPSNQSAARAPTSSSTSDQVSALIANNLMAHGNFNQDNLGAQ